MNVEHDTIGRVLELGAIFLVHLSDVVDRVVRVGLRDIVCADLDVHYVRGRVVRGLLSSGIRTLDLG